MSRVSVPGFFQIYCGRCVAGDCCTVDKPERNPKPRNPDVPPLARCSCCPSTKAGCSSPPANSDRFRSSHKHARSQPCRCSSRKRLRACSKLLLTRTAATPRATSANVPLLHVGDVAGCEKVRLQDILLGHKKSTTGADQPRPLPSRVCQRRHLAMCFLPRT